MRAQTPQLSIVIPVRNEAGAVQALASEIASAMTTGGVTWEAIWIDDGSTDQTVAQLAALAPPHRVLVFDRNHGQSAALAAGARAARAPWVGTLDGDGQNDPNDLVAQLRHAEASGVDMVLGIRARRHDHVVRKLSSRIANAARRAAVGAVSTDVGCATRIVRRDIMVALPFFEGMHRFFPNLVRMRGHAIDEIPVNHRPRRTGRTKYGINNRLWVGLRDLLGVRWLQARSRAWQARELSQLSQPLVAPRAGEVFAQGDEGRAAPRDESRPRLVASTPAPEAAAT